ncbi:MAG TPA: type II toxin-antitoxin system ParD family antitoxin [Candidatus Elarobacter sp.]|nr:type II toxin-antitoxin system ParD family antitoxin [Candidatus Elarobacter sp.]
MTISVTAELDRFVKEQVQSGKYASSSEVVRAGLRLLYEREQERAERRDALKRLVQEGLDDLRSGKIVESKTVFSKMRTIIDQAERDATVEIPSRE